MARHSYIVLTLVSRGAADAPGQGSELLLFALPERRQRGEVYTPCALFLLPSVIKGLSDRADDKQQCAARVRPAEHARAAGFPFSA